VLKIVDFGAFSFSAIRRTDSAEALTFSKRKAENADGIPGDDTSVLFCSQKKTLAVPNLGTYGTGVVPILGTRGEAMDTGETFSALLNRWADAQGWSTQRLRLLLRLPFSTVKAWRDSRSIPHELLIPGLSRKLDLPEDMVAVAWERSKRVFIPANRTQGIQL
jgi:hypothetical protein